MAYCIHRLNLEVGTASEHGDRKMRNQTKSYLEGLCQEDIAVFLGHYVVLLPTHKILLLC